MNTQNDAQEGHGADVHSAPATSPVKKCIWDIACIAFFFAGIAFLVCLWVQVDSNLRPIHYKELLIASALVAVVTSALCFLRTRTKISAVKFTALVFAALILAANWYIYFRYIPKYSLADGCAIVQADPKYASATVKPQYYAVYGDSDDMLAQTAVYYQMEDNPFYEEGYLLNVVTDGEVTAWIAFDCATGQYKVFYEPTE